MDSMKINKIKYIFTLLIFKLVFSNTEYLIYTTKDFTGAANLISDFHSNETHNELRLNSEIIYKETLDSLMTNINSYISDYISYNSDLKYLLIIGDEFNIEPQFFYGTATDDLFSSTMVGNYPIPRLITGRIIAENNIEAEFQIEKIKNYVMNPVSGIWRNKLLLISDDEYQNNNSIREEKYHTYFSNEIFENLSNFIPIRTLYGANFPKIQTSDWYLQPELTQKIINSINSGVGLINYIGHGTHEILSTENILSLSRDIDLLNTDGQSPIWVVGTCSFGDYIGKDCFAENLLKTENAAIAIISTTNGISPESNWHYLKSFYNTHLKNYIQNNANQRLGEIFFNSKQSALNLANSNEYPNNIYGGYRFNIFGDPALPLIISKANNITNLDSIYIGQENQINLQSDLFSEIKIFNENESKYNAYNYNINQSDYNPSLVDSCINFPYNPTTNQYYSCNDTLKFIVPGAKLYQNNFLNSLNFYIPLEVDNNNYIKLYIYNETSDYESKIQCINNIPISLSNYQNISIDTTGPEIRLFFDNNELFNNGLIFPPYNFKIELKDDLPLNLSGLNYHNIRLWIDNNQTNSIILNDLFINEENSDTSGKIYINIPDSLLNNEIHNLHIEAWDILNNQSVKNIRLNNAALDKKVFNIYNFPNPFSNITYFTFNLKDPEPIDVDLRIFNKNGTEIAYFNEIINEIKNFHQVPEEGFDGKDKNNKTIKNGTYFYNLKIKKMNGNLIFDTIKTFTFIKK